MDFQQSKTYQNILNAYNLESVVNTRYLLYADQARLENYIEIATIFETTARNEKEHARIWLRKINNGTLPNTEENLVASISYENDVGNNIYREYARVAREEGYNDIASLFNGIANIELNHGLRFQTYHANLVRGELLCKPEDSLWICMQCGNIMSGKCAPDICPVCGFPQGYYRFYSNEVL
ncbi:MAG: hypothetical protein H6Q59_3535 [Firmicutes bacterium]|nr:hypothetical protein [Bacillota bacterium]